MSYNRPYDNLVKIDSGKWKDIFAIGWTSFGIKEDGKLYSWGRNGYGLLGKEEEVSEMTTEEYMLYLNTLTDEEFDVEIARSEDSIYHKVPTCISANNRFSKFPLGDGHGDYIFALDTNNFLYSLGNNGSNAITYESESATVPTLVKCINELINKDITNKK